MGDVLFVDVVLLLLVVATGVAAVGSRSLLASTMFLGIYSLLMALVWVNMFAMDVAFTEAAVGAGVSTILLLGTMAIVGREEKKQRGAHWPALLIVVATGAALIYGTLDMPTFGDPNAPVHQRTAPEYIAQDVGHTHAADAHGPGAAHGEHAGDFGHHVPNLVTAVLADYRGYDTMFETAVIFTAGICLVLLLRAPTKRASADKRAE
jgi:multicomponent Na+:H+ antiporter subunit B